MLFIFANLIELTFSFGFKHKQLTQARATYNFIHIHVDTHALTHTYVHICVYFFMCVCINCELICTHLFSHLKFGENIKLLFHVTTKTFINTAGTLDLLKNVTFLINGKANFHTKSIISRCLLTTQIARVVFPP